VDPRAGLDGRKILSPPGFDPGPSSPYSVPIPTELPGPYKSDNIDVNRKTDIVTFEPLRLAYKVC